MYIKTGEGLGREGASKLSFATAWINNFETCKQKPLDHCDDVANGFGKMMEVGGHTWAIKLKEKEANPANWMDRSRGGKDAAPGRGVDTVDFAIIVSHGGLWPPRAAKQPHRVSVGFNQTPCRFFSDQTRFGDGKLKWLILDSCHSLEIDKKKGITPWGIWSGAFDGLHTMFGFTDVVSDSWWTEDRGSWFAFLIGGGDAELADTWIETAYSWKEDDYPVAATAGRDAKDADNRLETEKLSSSFDSIPNKEVKVIKWMWRS